MQVSTIFEIVPTVSPTSLVIALIVLLITAIYYALKSRGLPPGPVGLPYFGMWLFMNNTNCNQKLVEQKKKHGDVFSFTCAGQLYIHLGSIKAVREAHITKADCFGERLSEFSLLTSIFKDGVAFLNGEPWKVLRKFFLVNLKERGVTAMKNTASGSLYESINVTIQDLKAKKGEPVNLIELLTYKCSTILRLTVFGEVGASDEQIRKMNEQYATQLASMTLINMLVSGQIARYILLPLSPGYHAARRDAREMEKILQSIVNEHKLSYDEENPRDAIDDYFKERDIRRSKGDPTAEFFTDKALVGSLMQFVGDGVLSVAAFISMLLKILITHPGEQEKVYKEIVEVVGLERLPTIEDKNKLTYFNAFILEAQRTSDFLPFFPSLECTKETTLNGYRIPKGSVTVINFYCAHKDPEMFEEPEKFDPSRYIQAEGKRRSELPITFGVGKRACLGEGFVMMQAFLFLTALVQNFKITLSKDKLSSYEQIMEGVLHVVVQPRH